MSKALQGVGLQLLDEHLQHCVAGAAASGDERAHRVVGPRGHQGRRADAAGMSATEAVATFVVPGISCAPLRGGDHRRGRRAGRRGRRRSSTSTPSWSPCHGTAVRATRSSRRSTRPATRSPDRERCCRPRGCAWRCSPWRSSSRSARRTSVGRHRRRPGRAGNACGTEAHQHGVTTTTVRRVDAAHPRPHPEAGGHGGRRLRAAPRRQPAPTGTRCSYRVVGPDGATVTDFADNHGALLHTVADPRRPQRLPARPPGDRCRRHVDGHRAARAHGTSSSTCGQRARRATSCWRRTPTTRCPSPRVPLPAPDDDADRRRARRAARRPDVHRHHDRRCAGRPAWSRTSAHRRTSSPSARATWPTPTCTRTARRWPAMPDMTMPAERRRTCSRSPAR